MLLHYGKKHNSIVLEADGKHLMADVWTSVGVLVGIVLVILTGWTWLDPLLAIAVGLNIVWTGGELVYRSFNGLMDHALPAAEQEQIRAVIRAHLPGGRGRSTCCARGRPGARRFVEFHLLVDGDQTVRAAHHVAHVGRGRAGRGTCRGWK